MTRNKFVRAVWHQVVLFIIVYSSTIQKYKTQNNMSHSMDKYTRLIWQWYYTVPWPRKSWKYKLY